MKPEKLFILQFANKHKIIRNTAVTAVYWRFLPSTGANLQLHTNTSSTEVNCKVDVLHSKNKIRCWCNTRNDIKKEGKMNL